MVKIMFEFEKKNLTITKHTTLQWNGICVGRLASGGVNLYFFNDAVNNFQHPPTFYINNKIENIKKR